MASDEPDSEGKSLVNSGPRLWADARRGYRRAAPQNVIKGPFQGVPNRLMHAYRTHVDRSVKGRFPSGHACPYPSARLLEQGCPGEICTLP